MERNQLNFAVVLFILVFIISGGNKVLNYKTSASEALRFSKKTGFSVNSSEYIVFMAGLFELIASGLIIYATYADDKKYLEMGVKGLMLFTVLATLIFYTRPLKYKPFLSNLSILTGLYLIMRVCEFK